MPVHAGHAGVNARIRWQRQIVRAKRLKNDPSRSLKPKTEAYQTLALSSNEQAALFQELTYDSSREPINCSFVK